MLGYEVTKRYGGPGLPDDTIRITFTGSAGQSFGAFVPRGMTLTLVGDANDGFGKGLSGGRLTVFPPPESTFKSGGEHHHRQRGVLRRDQRRGVRPRRGRRAVLRPQQRRHGGGRRRGRPRLRVHDRRPRGRARAGPGATSRAGMSGGVAYVLDVDGEFARRCNTRDGGSRDARSMPDEIDLVQDADHEARGGDRQHATPQRLLERLGGAAAALVKVMPREYKRALAEQAKREAREAGSPSVVAVVGGRVTGGSRPATLQRGLRMGKPTGFIEIQRKKHPTRPVEERVQDWREVYLPYPTAELEAQGARCMDCGIPFCHQGCPLGNLIPGLERPRLSRPLAGGDRPPARDQQLPGVHRQAVPGAVRRLVRARHQRGPGHDQVDRGHDHRPRLGRRLGGAAAARRRAPGRRWRSSGSGPAGLAAADQLNRAGHSVTVFEKSDRIGGLLRYGIPEFKMEKRFLDRRLAVLEAEGVVFRAGVNVGVDVPADAPARRLRRRAAGGRRRPAARSAGARAASCRASISRWST